MPDTLVLCPAPLGYVPLLERLGPAAAAGFSAIALQPGDVWAAEAQGHSAADLAARIADAGLCVGEIDCTACWMERQRSGDDSELGRLLRGLTPERVIATAARIGAPSVAAIDLSPTPAPLDEAADGFARLCDMAAEHGLRAHIEFLPVGGIRTLADAWAIVREAGRANGGLTIDAWHLFRSGSTLAELADIPGERIHAVQLSDAPAQASADVWAELMSARLLPGEGAFDLAGLIQTLDRIGSAAPFGVEVFNTRQDGQSIAQIAQDWATAARAVLARARGTA
ncbi:MAG: sugar phosphate isomerase/epimerase [Novosphingobium sp.]|nr:sugar phosphate isomerase/epimerase [Novosphingobium sp.]